MKSKKGISLIVLVITIIVMIILAGAIILTLNNSGVLTKAEEAVERTNLAQIKEFVQVKWAEAYAKGARTKEELQEEVTKGLEGIDVSDYDIDVTESGVTVELKNTSTDEEEKTDDNTATLPTGWDATKVATTFTETSSVRGITKQRTVPIPTGFVVSGITGENTIAGGLVIYQTGSVDTSSASFWSDVNTCRTTYNQYVWIPVDDIDSMILQGGGKLYCYPGSYVKDPDNEFVQDRLSLLDPNKTDHSYYEDPGDRATEFSLMSQSVETYGGFFISRYEVNGTGVSKKGQTVLQEGEAGKITALRDTLYNSLNTTSSNMAWGCQYDQAALFIGDEAQTGHEDRNLTIAGATTTGTNSLDIMKNIFDLEGNCFELSAGEIAGAGGYIRSSGIGNGKLAVDGHTSISITRQASSTRLFLPVDLVGPYATRSCLII